MHPMQPTIVALVTSITAHVMLIHAYAGGDRPNHHLRDHAVQEDDEPTLPQ